MAIHWTKTGKKRPPTVAEVIAELQGCPQDLYCLMTGPGSTVNVPHPKVRGAYQDEAGWVRLQKVDAVGKIKHIKVVRL